MNKNTFCPFALLGGKVSGDTFPFFHAGLWHLFHVALPGIGHKVSANLLDWQDWGPVVAPGRKGEPDEHGVATGTVLEHDGKFFCFYTGNQNACLAISHDLKTWTKYADNPVLAPDIRRYDGPNFRDPYVFFHPREKCWWMLLGSRAAGGPPQRSAGIALARSNDLLHWTLGDFLWQPGTLPFADCPQLIQQPQGRWHLLYLERITRYRYAASPAGPFKTGGDLGTPPLAAASRPASDSKRWVTFPFFMRLQDEQERGQLLYGGPLCVPRELTFRGRAGIDEKPIREILHRIQRLPRAHLPRRPLHQTGQWVRSGPQSLRCKSPDGGSILLNATPDNFYLEASITPASGEFHLLLRCASDLTGGYQIAFSRSRKLIELRPLSRWDADQPLAVISANLGRTCRLRVFIVDSMLELFIDDRRSLTCRVYQHRTGACGFEFRHGSGTVTKLQLRPLAQPRGPLAQHVRRVILNRVKSLLKTKRSAGRR